MPSYIPATGCTLHLVVVCVNRIGKVRTLPAFSPKPLKQLDTCRFRSQSLAPKYLDNESLGDSNGAALTT